MQRHSKLEGHIMSQEECLNDMTSFNSQEIVQRETIRGFGLLEEEARVV